MSRFMLAACVAVILLGPGAVRGEDQQFTVRERVGERSPEVSFDFKDAKFPDVIDYFAKQSGANILVDGEIAETVTLRLVGVKWRRALDMVCQQVGAVVEEEGDQVLRISRPLTVNFELEDAPLAKVVGTIAKLAEATVIIGPNVKGVVTAQFYDVPWTQALDYIVRTSGFVALKEGKIFRIMDPSALDDQMVTRVFQLRYVQAPDSYVAHIESKFAVEAKQNEKGTSVTGTGEVLGPTGIAGSVAARRAAAETQAAATGGAGTSFPLLDAIQRVASRKGRVDYIATTNSLIVTDTEPNIKAIAELIDTMDREPMQVFIDVKFVATKMTNQLNHGVNWPNGFNFTSTYGSVVSRLPFTTKAGGWESNLDVRPGGATADDITAGIADHTSQKGPFTFGLLDFSQMSQTMELMSTDTNTELKQSPQILVIDNQQATIFVGETIRFAETDSASNQSGGVETGIREATNSPVDTGFQLLVRPHVVAGEDKVVLSVIPKSEQLSGTGQTIPGFDDFTNGTAKIQLPRVQSSTLVTKLILKHGQTAVLGGMIQETNSKTEHKVPFFGDIPVLGWAFKWNSALKNKNNLLIFLTVCIVRSDSDVKDIYTVYGGKYGGKTFQEMQKESGNWHRTKESGYRPGVKTGTAANDL